MQRAGPGADTLLAAAQATFGLLLDLLLIKGLVDFGKAGFAQLKWDFYWLPSEVPAAVAVDYGSALISSGLSLLDSD
ncbi:Uncharacterised protein [Serratia fonticola]|uniref:Uncharacterized protein n=1 Tax=Serratia fonticola TaxID=47917 RepID=A0A4U9VHK6_SERFO|nr:Uncharacterised protein [Serratia fonticola]